MSLRRPPEDEALDRLILEVREQRAPELDWQRVEAQLMRETKAATRASRGQGWATRLRLASAFGMGLAAAVTVLVLHRAPPAPPAASTPRAVLASGPLNGDQLALGAHVSAGDRQVVVEHAGRARWTLEPHASAYLSELGDSLTLRLESGALSAVVVPNPKPETFAIEVDGTRVAVHGTAFRVERAGERVLVSVSEGTVAVEPSGMHGAPSFLLQRDSRGNFGLDGRTGSVEGNASAVLATDRARSHRQVSLRPASARPRVTPSAAAEASAAAPPPVSSAPPAALPEPSAIAQASPPELAQRPSISEIEAGVSSALELMNQCFQGNTHSTGIHVTASTGLTLSISGEGSVQSVTFAPPLAPTVEECAVTGLRQLKFAPTAEGVTFTRVFELSR